MAFDLPEAAHVTGIDISKVAIERLAARAADDLRLQFEVMDAENLEFPVGSFDVVCGSGILHHLDVKRSLAEIARVLSAEGSAIFLEPLGHNVFINWYRRMTPSMRSVDEHPLLMSDLQIAHQHFASVEVKFFHLMSLGAVGLRKWRIFEAALGGLDAADAALFSALPGFRKFAWMCVMVLGTPIRFSSSNPS